MGKQKFSALLVKGMRQHVIKLLVVSCCVSLILIFYYSFSTSPPRRYRIVNPNTAQTRPNSNKGNISKNVYVIHIWMHGDRMKRRFLRSYGNLYKNPYRYCSADNCLLSTNSSDVQFADAVFFHLHQTTGPETLPRYHPPEQYWIFFTDESPYHTFYASNKYDMKDYNGIFNWSMTYRRDADIYMPYGRTVPLTDAEKKSVQLDFNYAKTKSGTVAILGSNCGGQNHRWEYVNELSKHIKVDVYGRCGNLTCPGNFANDCPLINDYKFYLAFENSNCKEYITEKLWWNAYHKDMVPIVMGAPKKDYEALCPPHSFIHVNDFKTPKELAEYLKMLDLDDTAYNQYFQWKGKFKVLNEHGYFGSPSLHLCRICEKLNSKTLKPKIYNDLEQFWNKHTDCSSSSFPKNTGGL